MGLVNQSQPRDSSRDETGNHANITVFIPPPPGILFKETNEFGGFSENDLLGGFVFINSRYGLITNNNRVGRLHDKI